MKSRHVRAVAVFGIVVFALTGARGSGGGGCSGGSSSSSSSSSGGSSSGGSDSGSTSTSGGSTTVGTGGSSSSQRGAARDLKIETCTYDNGLVSRVRATNSSSTSTYSYEFDLEFTDASGTVLHTAEDNSIPSVPPGESATVDVKAPAGTVDDGASGGSCKLTDLERSSF
ncbi:MULTISPECIES: hypothetical protein [Streptomyces]|uniref:Secreted protein n=1 Tax=Streptomyces caniscabiei TaxID=2746961 RepID=A0ABU4MQT1_9ACTN|nr:MULTISPECIES: hypothetical protein [Streptomyces]MBE4738314.1 hypothetical protein [Streptomyces caniscabiei]MBE4757076.1 hypothetical protein [Streptomyces caniscabiei]MBE4770270.1 hypothetical protein [Streptomyces caniscabiei]MBE4785414.1 hypothetical protein [Streptomyces caniscabiei]MBE4796756.1 hypothetical protein [Streptomyces caniscabiei]